MRLTLVILLLIGCGGTSVEVSDARHEETARPPLRLEAPDDVAAPPADAEVSTTGLTSRVLIVGHGEAHPGSNARVTIHYTGWTPNGQRVDSSLPRGEPATLSVDRTIDGMTEALQLMVAGERRRLWIPADLAYAGRRGPQGPLVFDVELISFVAPPPPPPTPTDVAEPPPDAARSASGLAWTVLQPGTGTAHPAETSEVTVHYSGWRAETGVLFDSSVARGEPATFPLNRVIDGWTEGVQLMVVGERRRFWIPVELAYRNRPGRPAGMLVFDIELLAID
ncbi:MAG: FKBP-type peptidyl-prolyl cis-trans isomerase [Sandaracinaceae bacterium]